MEYKHDKERNNIRIMILAEKIKILDELHCVIMAALVGHEYHVNESTITPF